MTRALPPTEDPGAWMARKRQLEIILRAYRDDCLTIRLAEGHAAFPAHPPTDMPTRPAGAVSDPTLQGAVWLTTDLGLGWARWRAGVLWQAYAGLPTDLRNVVALSYWHFSGGEGGWQDVARLMHIEKSHYYRLLNRALRGIDAALPPESQDLALWFGDVAPSGDAGE